MPVPAPLTFLALLFIALGQAAEPGVDPGRDFDLQGFIDRRLAAGDRTVAIPPGRHRVTPRNRSHLRLRGLAGVVIDARGAELVCTQTTNAVTIQDCRQLTIKGLAIDYDPLPYAQGVIADLAPDRSWLEIRLEDGYPLHHPTEGAVEIFAAATRELRMHTRYNWKPAERTGPDTLRLVHDASYRYDPSADLCEAGDLVVLGSSLAPGGSIPHGISSDGCEDLVLEDVTVYASNCFAFVEHGCSRSVYRRCQVLRRPLAEDLAVRASPRLRSSNADAFHSIGATVGPSLLGCTARNQGDDGVNIRGSFLQVIDTEGGVVHVAAPRQVDDPAKLALREGDPLQILDADGRLVEGRSIKTIAHAGAMTADDKEILAEFKIRPSITAAQGQVFALTLDQPVELAAGSVVCAANRIGSGFRIEGCTFAGNRSRGILVKASQGTIRDNTIQGTWLEAILIAPEHYWLEGGSASDLTISGNRIVGCQRGLTILAQDARGGLAPAGAHQRIRITGNAATDTAWPAILVTSTAGLVLEGNTVDAAPPTDPLRDRARSATRLRQLKLPAQDPLSAVLIHACTP